MSQTKYVIILLLMLQVIISPGQSKSKAECREIDVKIEVLKSPETGKSNTIKITLNEKGNFVVRMLDPDVKVTELKRLELKDLPPGDYTIFVNGRGNEEGRCPYHQVVKIERQ